MKVGILTFHRAKNYGAVLQCYALQQYIRDLGVEVEVIDYYPAYFKEQDKVWSLKSLKRKNIKGFVYEIFQFFLTLPIVLRRRKRFNDFVKRMTLSVRQFSESNFSTIGYDVIIVGSDQVWNPTISKGEDKIFAGSFPHSGCMLVAYAASTMAVHDTKEYEAYFRRIINNFDQVSVREERLNDYLNGLIAGSSICVADPVLLLEKRVWEEMAIPPNEHDYLLVYTVPEDQRIDLLANMIANDRQLRVVKIVARVKPFRKGYCLQGISPQQFVGYFAYASYVVTTSFHGTAFSLKMERQFSTLMLGGELDERARSLLNRVGLSDRAIEADALSLPSEDINYNLANPRIRQYVSESEQYLKQILPI